LIQYVQVKAWIAGAALLAAACVPPFDERPLARGPLDGKTFTTVFGDGTTSDPDEVVFRDGTFHSKLRGRYGFAAATYTAVRDGRATRFEAVAKSPTSGTMRWQGRVVGKQIEGTAVWDLGWWQRDREYTFKGKQK
jgi:hypothetical protein